MLRIIIEQDDRIGTPPQVHTFATQDQAQARDGGGAPSPAALKRQATKGPASARTSAASARPAVAGARDAGAAPRVFQTHVLQSTTMPIMPESSRMAQPSNGGAAPGGKA